ncbi:MAG: leucyl/phenylalanyl-tRNA--protein transferase [Vibrio sp.]
MTIYLPQLGSDPQQFPDINTALEEPDGLLAMGGDLSCQRLIHAYQQGIFPWFSHNEPILWWSPSQRMVLEPSAFHLSKSMAKFIRKTNFTIRFNTATALVIQRCADTRPIEEQWITPSMQRAYIELAEQGLCQSVEVWEHDELVGGLYGLTIGSTFCGESMFSIKTNASKLAFWALCQHFSRHKGQLIDCQLHNPHLDSLGAKLIPRRLYLTQLIQGQAKPVNNAFYQQALLHPHQLYQEVIQDVV